ncbi:MAG: 50S ribosomal protein L22 [Planctomycetota bacterium]|jgi:large subunit ribosomal protein L22|nr:50S ribosomal protein L22 [Planctomycetota bacterium]
MEFKASHRFARMSARKVRYVADQVRGQNAKRAESMLKFSPKRAAVLVNKVVANAAQHADLHAGIQVEDLVVEKIWIDEGPTFKRWRPRAMGRATPIMKRTCHINVVLAPAPGVEAE